MIELIIQGVFALIMFKIIQWTIKSGRNAIVYWLIIALYLLAAIWVTYDYFSTPDSDMFLIEVSTMIVPAVLGLIAGIIFFFIYFISLGAKKSRTND